MKNLRGLVRIGMLLGLFLLLELRRAEAQPPLPPIPQGQTLNFWPFDDTNLLSGRGFGPRAASNLLLVPSWNNYSLQIDDSNSCVLIYNVVDTNTADGLAQTNLALARGTIEGWVSSDWDSGTGPGNWGTLLEVGNWDTNLTTNSSAFGLYFSPDGTSLNLAAESGLSVTNFFSFPIAWNSGDWHYVVLTYDQTNTNVSLYLDGDLATNLSISITNLPGPEVLSNGFSIGSDGLGSGMRQMRAEISDLWTYNYALDSNSIADYYAYMAADEVYPLPVTFSPGSPADDGPPSPGGGGGGGGGSPDTNFDYSFDTNGLWLNPLTLVSNLASLALMNSTPDVLYEIQTIADLTQTNWISAGFVYGSELSNWTALSLPQSSSTNLFARVRSWADTTGTGIPDWWWLQYFGQTTNVNAYTNDPAGDGYTDLQKFQFGIAPDTYYNTNPPAGFFGCLDATGTNVFLEWSSSPGPVTNYQVQRGILDTNGNYNYAVIGNVSSNTTYFEDTGAISNANAWNNIYSLVAQYPAGIVTPADTWYASYGEFGDTGAPYGAPVPGNPYAYAQPGGTNVVVSWTAAAPGAAPTNYIVLRGTLDTNTSEYSYSPAASVATNVNYFPDVIQSNNDWNNIYEIEAQFPGGVLSVPAAASASISTNAPGPTTVAVVIDTTGTNVEITWTPPAGMAVSNYVIERGVFNTNTDTYSYSQIGTVSSNTTSFQDTGAISGNNSFNNAYQVQVHYSWGAYGISGASLLGPPPGPIYNIYVTANLIRNQTGRWQIMFSGLPTNATQTIQLTWSDGFGDVNSEQNISTTNLVNSIYLIGDSNAVNNFGNYLSVQLFGPDGEPGQVAQAGFMANDAPYFVDGRQHLQESLAFLLRAGSLTQAYSYYGDNYRPDGYKLAGSPNFVAVSFIHPDMGFVWSTNFEGYTPAFVLDDLWPFKMDYELDNWLYTTNAVPTFSWEPDFETVPAPPVLAQGNPYWILTYATLIEYSDIDPSDWGAIISGNSISLAAGSHNVYGLAMDTGLVLSGVSYPENYGELAPGTNIMFYDPLDVYYSQADNPELETVGYYFAPVTCFGTNLSLNTSYSASNQIVPVPLTTDNQLYQYGFEVFNGVQPLPDFAVTNQTPLIVGTVGQPMLIGGWAKQEIVNGASGKFGYLGQYFETNAYLLATNGSVTTNSAGIVSPYGDFFPLQAGVAEMTTMPDIDTGMQGTNYIRVISLNVDANHDGTMDFSYSGPDQTSSSRPFRFWISDSDNTGDDGGDGIPGETGPNADGQYWSYSVLGVNRYFVQGRRHLEDFFPVYFNIGSLFQSNALSTGISPSDTNYQFVLSQADSALRFAYTDLTPTNYLNYLLDTNESGKFEAAPLTTITSNGIVLPTSFLNGVISSNQGVILVEAWTPTSQPLALTIFHGTNQVAQTQLYLSMSRIEQMFRHKSLLLAADNREVNDRLLDSRVPNEPDTTDNNFIFLHGYNVNPQQARGNAADLFKRMYWSGSHAKFWYVDWSGYESQLGGVTWNFHTNEVHAFQTGPLLSAFLNSLPGTNIVSAHSLGNMVVLSALNDASNQTISKFFMLDSAVALEDLEGIGTNASFYMTHSDWTDGASNLWGQAYGTNVWASYWHNLFTNTDARSQLTWENRLADLQNADVYNFYSTGEEVLRAFPIRPTPNFGDFIADQVYQISFSNTPASSYVWCLQELQKGRMTVNLVGSTYGGWWFNDGFYVTNGTGHISPANAALLSPTNLIVEPVFDNTVNTALFTTNVSASAFASTNRNAIIADEIPALTLPAGANPVDRLDILFGSTHNFNMETLQNGWPAGRLSKGIEATNWYHSDFHNVAYTYTHKLFDQMITIGNLK